jgi:hypothetical protein
MTRSRAGLALSAAVPNLLSTHSNRQAFLNGGHERTLDDTNDRVAGRLGGKADPAAQFGVQSVGALDLAFEQRLVFRRLRRWRIFG